MQEKKPSFEIVDKRGANKDPVVREVPAVVTEPTGDIHTFKSVGYIYTNVNIAKMGDFPVFRGIGLRGDGLLPIVEWIIPPIVAEGIEPTKYVRQRLDTFLGCKCVQKTLCSDHQRYLQQWFQADMDRLNLIASTPVNEALEVYLRAEQARQQQRIAVPGRYYVIVIPYDGKIWLYGPETDDIESQPVFEEDYEQLPALREYMLDIMRKTKAIALAAPQVGVFKQFIIVKMDGGGYVDMINPDIVSMTGKELMGFECCLSVPPAGNDCAVPRMQRIIVECSHSARPREVSDLHLEDRDAVLTQHEIDHLTGTFFFDRVSNSAQHAVLKRLTHWKDENLPHGQSKLIATAGF